MRSVFRSVLAVAAGFVVASAVMMAIETVNGRVLYPELRKAAEGMTDREAIRNLLAGAPVGVELGRHSFKDELGEREKGSCMIVVATDAPLDARQLGRLAARTPMGLARAGGFASNGSGDYAIAFTAHPGCRVTHDAGGVRTVPVLSDDDLSPLLLAVVEATEEAVVNSLLTATTVTGIGGHTAEAIPVDRVVAILERHTLLRGR